MHQRRTSVAVVLACAALLVPACGKAAKKAPPPGKPTTVETLCAEADESDVRITGYFRYPRSMSGFFCETRDGHKVCDMSLYATGGDPPNNDVSDILAAEPPAPIAHVTLKVPVGGQPGEMKGLPARFSTDDVLLHLAGGAKIGEGGKVTLDGKLGVWEDAADPKVPGSKPSRHCWVNVAWATPAT